MLAIHIKREESREAMELLYAGKDETADSLKRRLSAAKRLGHKEAAVVFANPDKRHRALIGEAKTEGIKALLGVIARDQEQARKARPLYDCVFAQPRREMVECKAVTHIIEPEVQPRSDFIHHRNSGLNQVLLAICKRQGKEVVTTLAALSSAHPTVILGRMMQNARFCRKYKVTYRLASGARTLWEQRAADDLKALGREIAVRGRNDTDKTLNTSPA